MKRLKRKVLRETLTNYKGESLIGLPQLRKPEYSTEKWGIAWPKESNTVDKYGFDKTNVECNSNYKIKVILPPGTIIIRYGKEDGHFTAPQGTEYEKLSLPYVKETVPYFEYRVKKKTTVKCEVIKGRVAPAFDCEGGGIQYYHPITIGISLQKGILERVRKGGKCDE